MMNRIGIAGMALISLASAPAVAAAQRCEGTASFAGGGPRFGTSVARAPYTTTLAGEITFGRNNSLFASAGYSHTKYDNSNLFSGGLQGSLGYEFALGSRVQFCPIASVGRTSVMLFPGHGRLDMSTTAIGVGGSLGVTAASSRNFDFIPSVGLQFVAARSSTEYAVIGLPASSSKWHGTMGNLSLSSGFVLHKAITLSPMLTIPLGINHAGSMYGLGLSYSFGHDW